VLVSTRYIHLWPYFHIDTDIDSIKHNCILLTFHYWRLNSLRRFHSHTATNPHQIRRSYDYKSLVWSALDVRPFVSQRPNASDLSRTSNSSTNSVRNYLATFGPFWSRTKIVESFNLFNFTSIFTQKKHKVALRIEARYSERIHGRINFFFWNYNRK